MGASLKAVYGYQVKYAVPGFKLDSILLLSGSFCQSAGVAVDGESSGTFFVKSPTSTITGYQQIKALPPSTTGIFSTKDFPFISLSLEIVKRNSFEVTGQTLVFNQFNWLYVTADSLDDIATVWADGQSQNNNPNFIESFELALTMQELIDAINAS